MQMSQVSSINGVFDHKSHHPSCCSGNLPTMIVTLGPSLKTKRAFQSILQETSVRFRHNLPSLKHQQRSDRMVSLREYEIYSLFLLLVKFHGSGKCEVIPSYKGFYSIFLPCAFLSLDTENADLYFYTQFSSK